MNSNLKHHLAEYSATALVFLFAYTAVGKLLTRELFERTLLQSPLLATSAPVLAWLIPLTELGVIGLLLVPRYRTAGLWISLALLLLFTGYIAYMIAVTPHLPCSCGGVLRQLSWRQHLFFNGCFIVLAALALRLSPPLKSHTASIAASTNSCA